MAATAASSNPSAPRIAILRVLTLSLTVFAMLKAGEFPTFFLNRFRLEFFDVAVCRYAHVQRRLQFLINFEPQTFSYTTSKGTVDLRQHRDHPRSYFRHLNFAQFKA